jgi:hypothetical protein
MTGEILSYIGISLIGWLGLLLAMTGDDPNVRIRGGARVPRNNINDAERVSIPTSESYYGTSPLR